MFPFLIQGSNVVVVIDNTPHTISKTHITYQKVVDAIKAGDWDAVRDTINPKKVVLNYGAGNIAVQGEKLFWKGLYGFLEKNRLPITGDGHFLAYKKVRDNFMDVYTGTMDNSVGKFVEMERNQVNDDKNQTCSAGLHFCSESYLNHFGGERTVIVKINPRDVVSIPTDYDNAKGRACRYEVIGEVGVMPNDEEEFTAPVQENANSWIEP